MGHLPPASPGSLDGTAGTLWQRARALSRGVSKGLPPCLGATFPPWPRRGKTTAAAGPGLSEPLGIAAGLVLGQETGGGGGPGQALCERLDGACRHCRGLGRAERPFRGMSEPRAKLALTSGAPASRRDEDTGGEKRRAPPSLQQVCAGAGASGLGRPLCLGAPGLPATARELRSSPSLKSLTAQPFHARRPRRPSRPFSRLPSCLSWRGRSRSLPSLPLGSALPGTCSAETSRGTPLPKGSPPRKSPAAAPPSRPTSSCPAAAPAALPCPAAP